MRFVLLLCHNSSVSLFLTASHVTQVFKCSGLCMVCCRSQQQVVLLVVSSSSSSSSSSTSGRTLLFYCEGPLTYL